MPPIILKRSEDPQLRPIVVVDAVVASLLLLTAWISAGWLGFILLDPHASDATRLIALGATAAWQVAAFAIAARARRQMRLAPRTVRF